MMKIVSVNISEKKGTVKKPVESIELYEHGVRDDAHSGRWHRQVSLLARESFEKFEKIAGRSLQWGEFAENITTEGLTLHNCKPFDIFTIGGVILEVTQIGKSCHGDNCAIYREVGNCVMPKEGIFCRVVKGGSVKAGDTFEYHPKRMKVSVITLSDRAHSGEYSDRSGPLVAGRIEAFFDKEGWPADISSIIIPDDSVMLQKLVTDAAKTQDLIITTGGTGLGSRDITTDALLPLIDKEIPGVMEMIRLKYGTSNPNALISRSIAGVRGKTMIFALPGSVKAVNEYMDEIEKVIRHLLFMIHGIDNH